MTREKSTAREPGKVVTPQSNPERLGKLEAALSGRLKVEDAATSRLLAIAGAGGSY